jgi:hypothetical protein
MSIPIDVITRKKLILVKQLYQQAVVQSESQHSYVSRILSLIGFDLSVETVLKTIVAVLEPAKTPADGFQGLIQQADRLLADAGLPSIPEKANIQHVHSLRNDAQHKAKYPNETDVSDSRTYVRDFLSKSISNVWGVTFETLSLTDVIQHAEAKTHLTAAETAAINGSYQEAIAQAEAGLRVALGGIETAIIGERELWSYSPTNSYTERELDTRVELDRIRDFVTIAAVGLNFSDYIRYKLLIKSVIADMAFYGDGKMDFNFTGKQVSAKEAEFAVAYAVNAVTQIESQVGDIDAPFGIRYWV